MKRTYRPDPRIVGGTYWCRYWSKSYTVLAITTHNDWRGLSWTVQWEDGTTNSHSTSWDWKRDRIVYTPTA